METAAQVVQNGAPGQATMSNDANLPTMATVYEQILKQKRDQQAVNGNLGQATVPGKQPLQTTPAPQDQAQGLSVPTPGSFELRWTGQPAQSQAVVFRSTTMEGIRDMIVSAGGSLGLEDTMLQWGSLPAERFLEGLASDMKEIASGQPPDAQNLRTTFTIERIVSGGERDLQALARETGVRGGSIALVGGAGVTSALVEANTAQQGQQGPAGNHEVRAAGSQGVQQQQHNQQQQMGQQVQDHTGGTQGGAVEPESSQPTKRSRSAQSHPDALQHNSAGGALQRQQQQQQAQQQQQQQPQQQQLSAAPPSPGLGAAAAQQVLWRQGSSGTQASVGQAVGGGAGGGGGTGGGFATSLAPQGSGIVMGPDSMQAWSTGVNGLGALDLTLAANEAEVLERENADLQGQLDMLLAQIDLLQQDNGRMKSRLLEACASNGIQATISQLNATIAMHRPVPMGDGPATDLASAALSAHNGDVTATLRYFLQMAISRTRGTPLPPQQLQKQQQVQQIQKQQQMLQQGLAGQQQYMLSKPGQMTASGQTAWPVAGGGDGGQTLWTQQHVMQQQQQQQQMRGMLGDMNSNNVAQLVSLPAGQGQGPMQTMNLMQPGLQLQAGQGMTMAGQGMPGGLVRQGLSGNFSVQLQAGDGGVGGGHMGHMTGNIVHLSTMQAHGINQYAMNQGNIGQGNIGQQNKPFNISMLQPITTIKTGTGMSPAAPIQGTHGATINLGHGGQTLDTSGLHGITLSNGQLQHFASGGGGQLFHENSGIPRSLLGSVDLSSFLNGYGGVMAGQTQGSASQIGLSQHP